MNIPPSPHFTPLSLTGAFNVDRQTLTGMLQPPEDQTLVSGTQVYLGIPFACGGVGEGSECDFVG